MLAMAALLNLEYGLRIVGSSEVPAIQESWSLSAKELRSLIPVAIQGADRHSSSTSDDKPFLPLLQGGDLYARIGNWCLRFAVSPYLQAVVNK